MLLLFDWALNFFWRFFLLLFFGDLLFLFSSCRTWWKIQRFFLRLNRNLFLNNCFVFFFLSYSLRLRSLYNRRFLLLSSYCFRLSLNLWNFCFFLWRIHIFTYVLLINLLRWRFYSRFFSLLLLSLSLLLSLLFSQLSRRSAFFLLLV